MLRPAWLQLQGGRVGRAGRGGLRCGGWRRALLTGPQVLRGCRMPRAAGPGMLLALLIGDRRTPRCFGVLPMPRRTFHAPSPTTRSYFLFPIPPPPRPAGNDFSKMFAPLIRDGRMEKVRAWGLLGMRAPWPRPSLDTVAAVAGRCPSTAASFVLQHPLCAAARTAHMSRQPRCRTHSPMPYRVAVPPCRTAVLLEAHARGPGQHHMADVQGGRADQEGH